MKTQMCEYSLTRVCTWKGVREKGQVKGGWGGILAYTHWRWGGSSQTPHSSTRTDETVSLTGSPETFSLWTVSPCRCNFPGYVEVRKQTVPTGILPRRTWGRPPWQVSGVGLRVEDGLLILSPVWLAVSNPAHMVDNSFTWLLPLLYF